MGESKTLVQAKIGDSVALGKPEFDVINDAEALRVTEAVKYQKAYTRAEVMKRKAELEIELGNVERLIAQMDLIGVK